MRTEPQLSSRPTMRSSFAIQDL